MAVDCSIYEKFTVVGAYNGSADMSPMMLAFLLAVGTS